MAQMRDSFFAKVRPEVYLGLPKTKLSRKGERMIALSFVVTMSPAHAKACDQKIQRAYDDCADLSWQIMSAQLGMTVPNTDINIYELVDHADPLFILRNVELEGMQMERSDGAIYLSFSIELLLGEAPGLWHFIGERFATTAWIEFAASQYALTGMGASAKA